MDRHKNRGCCNVPCMKTFYMFFNVILMFSGIAILAVGIWIFSAKSQYNSLLTTDNYTTVPGLMIAAGCLVIIVCIVGCVGVIKENRFILVSYLIMLVLILVLEVATGLVAIIYRSEITQEIELSIRGKMNQYGFSDDVTKAIDKLQKENKCCGDKGLYSWNNTSWKQSELSGNNSVPDSCCKTPANGCGVRLHPSNIQENGCIDKLLKFFEDHLMILAGVGLGLGFSQLFGIITAIILLRYIEQY